MGMFDLGNVYSYFITIFLAFLSKNLYFSSVGVTIAFLAVTSKGFVTVTTVGLPVVVTTFAPLTFFVKSTVFAASVPSIAFCTWQLIVDAFQPLAELS